MSNEDFYAQQDKDTWETPSWVTDILQGHLTIDTDPCAGPETDIATTNYWYPKYDGFEETWSGTVYINPPFTAKKDWIQAAIDRYESGEIDNAIILTPDSTDVQSWWHGMLAEHCPVTWFSEGRISYIDPDTGEKAGSPTFGTALSFMGEIDDFPMTLYDDLSDHGELMVRWDSLDPSDLA